MQLLTPINTYAQTNEINPKASDTVSISHSKTFSYSKNYITMSPDVMINDSQITKASFRVRLDSAIQYDRISGSYVSCSTPTATVIPNYTAEGRFYLSLQNVRTSKRDNGSSITFSYSATVVGTLDSGLVISLNYGTVSDSFTVTK